MVPATFLYSLYLTVYRTDISPSQTLSVFPKVSVLERVVSTTVVLELLVRSLLIGRKKQWRVILSIVSVLFGVRETHHNFSSDIYYPDLWSDAYGISTLVSQKSFHGETSGGVAKCRLFSMKILRLHFWWFFHAHLKQKNGLSFVFPTLKPTWDFEVCLSRAELSKRMTDILSLFAINTISRIFLFDFPLKGGCQRLFW